jgi:hypothetical protein
MKFFRYRRPSAKTLFGVTKAKKRVKKEEGRFILNSNYILQQINQLCASY